MFSDSLCGGYLLWLRCWGAPQIRFGVSGVGNAWIKTSNIRAIRGRRFTPCAPGRFFNVLIVRVNSGTKTNRRQSLPLLVTMPLLRRDTAVHGTASAINVFARTADGRDHQNAEFLFNEPPIPIRHSDCPNCLLPIFQPGGIMQPWTSISSSPGGKINGNG